MRVTCCEGREIEWMGADSVRSQPALMNSLAHTGRRPAFRPSDVGYEAWARWTKPLVQSLFIKMRNAGKPLATGTGFVVELPTGPVLVTNWHNLTGRNSLATQPLSATGALPDEVMILHNKASHLGQWVQRSEALYQEGQILWNEHPTLGSRADMVALPLTALDEVELCPYDITSGPSTVVGPADPVSVVGFPFGWQAAGSLEVRATRRSGFVASGSAVIAYRSGGTVAMAGGGTTVFARPVSSPVTSISTICPRSSLIAGLARGNLGRRSSHTGQEALWPWLVAAPPFSHGPSRRSSACTVIASIRNQISALCGRRLQLPHWSNPLSDEQLADGGLASNW